LTLYTVLYILQLSIESTPKNSMKKQNNSGQLTTDDGRPLLKMKELVEATGVPKSTILHYVNEGLLPEPVKTSMNMAYYDPDCIERVRFIKSMQSNHRFPLNKIRSMLEWKDHGRDVTLGMELLQGVFGTGEGQFFDEPEFCRATGLSPKQVEELVQAKLLLPLNSERFDQEDISMGIMYAKALSRGITPNDMSYYSRLGKQIVDEEMALRRRMTHHLSYEADAEQTLMMLRAARATRSYVIDRLFQLRIAKSKDLKDEDLLS
jgi:DNA-binding transcriptional MerR regulator